MRPIEFGEAVKTLASWAGRRITVTISDRRGIKLAWIQGVLADHSRGVHVAFSVDDPDDVAPPIPLSLAGPRDCAASQDRVRIATAGEVVVLFALGRG